MAQQVYELNSNGVYGLRNGVYADSLVTIIDDFEDADIAEYTGDTGAYSTVTSPVANGSYSLEGTAASGAVKKIVSTTGLNAYPAQGDTWRTNHYLRDTDDFSYHWFGVQDGSNAYQTGFEADSDTLILHKVSSGSYTTLASTSVAISSNLSEMVALKIGWATDGTITVTAYEASGTKLGSVSATDTTYASGGIGWRIYNPNASTTQNFDYARVVA